MLDDLSKLIIELRETTSSIAGLRRQRKIFVNGVVERTDVDDLETIEEAHSSEGPAVSSAISERRITLTEAAKPVWSFPFSRLNQTMDEDIGNHAGSDDGDESVEAHGADSSDGKSTLLQVLTALRSLLGYPQCDDEAIAPEIAEQFRNNRPDCIRNVGPHEDPAKAPLSDESYHYASQFDARLCPEASS
ncbi:MAG: hypothetical protein Q9173_004079 [Seirophora scorigena]